MGSVGNIVSLLGGSILLLNAILPVISIKHDRAMPHCHQPGTLITGNRTEDQLVFNIVNLINQLASTLSFCRPTEQGNTVEKPSGLNLMLLENNGNGPEQKAISINITLSRTKKCSKHTHPKTLSLERSSSDKGKVKQVAIRAGAGNVHDRHLTPPGKSGVKRPDWVKSIVKEESAPKNISTGEEHQKNEAHAEELKKKGAHIEENQKNGAHAEEPGKKGAHIEENQKNGAYAEELKKKEVHTEEDQKNGAHAEELKKKEVHTEENQKNGGHTKELQQKGALSGESGCVKPDEVEKIHKHDGQYEVYEDAFEHNREYPPGNHCPEEAAVQFHEIKPRLPPFNHGDPTIFHPSGEPMKNGDFVPLWINNWPWSQTQPFCNRQPIQFPAMIHLDSAPNERFPFHNEGREIRRFPFDHGSSNKQCVNNLRHVKGKPVERRFYKESRFENDPRLGPSHFPRNADQSNVGEQSNDQQWRCLGAW